MPAAYMSDVRQVYLRCNHSLRATISQAQLSVAGLRTPDRGGRYLIQGFAGHLDAVNLQHLIVNGQQPGALRQTARHQTGDEDTGYLPQRHAAGQPQGRYGAEQVRQ